jgi:hypothetical protein
MAHGTMKFQKTIKGYPPEFLYTVFTNTEVNKQENNLTKPGMTILEAINKAQDKVGYFKDRKFTAQTIQKFLELPPARTIQTCLTWHKRMPQRKMLKTF